MAEYEISNPLADNLSIRSGPGVIFGRIGSLEPGARASGDYIFTFQSELVVEGQTWALTGDRWIHVSELNGAAVDGWTAISHLGQSYATITQLPVGELSVRFNVELEGYNPTTLTGTLTPR